MANAEQLAILKKSVQAWNEWRMQNLIAYIDLTNADLRGRDLKRADLSGADLSGADLREADLRGASLQGVNSRGAKLNGVRIEEDERPKVKPREVNPRAKLSNNHPTGPDSSNHRPGLTVLSEIAAIVAGVIACLSVIISSSLSSSGVSAQITVLPRTLPGFLMLSGILFISIGIVSLGVMNRQFVRASPSAPLAMFMLVMLGSALTIASALIYLFVPLDKLPPLFPPTVIPTSTPTPFPTSTPTFTPTFTQTLTLTPSTTPTQTPTPTFTLPP